MCLNSGEGNDNGQIFFQNFLEEGGKWQRGENDRGYYGSLVFKIRLYILYKYAYFNCS